jgi:hypothetical protein
MKAVILTLALADDNCWPPTRVKKLSNPSRKRQPSCTKS